MTTPDGLTAESEALVNWALDVFYEDRPFVSEQLGDMLRAIEAAAVARHVRDTGCDEAVADRDAARHSLGSLITWLSEYHPGYITEYDRFRAKRAALAPTLAAVKVKDCACNESSNCFAHPNAPSPATEEAPR